MQGEAEQDTVPPASPTRRAASGCARTRPLGLLHAPLPPYMSHSEAFAQVPHAGRGAFGFDPVKTTGAWLPVSGAGSRAEEGCMDFQTYTDRARGFVQAAQTIAQREGHQQLGADHLLKALLDDPKGMAAELSQRCGGRPAEALAAIERALAKR